MPMPCCSGCATLADAGPRRGAGRQIWWISNSDVRDLVNAYRGSDIGLPVEGRCRVGSALVAGDRCSEPLSHRQDRAARRPSSDTGFRPTCRKAAAMCSRSRSGARRSGSLPAQARRPGCAGSRDHRSSSPHGTAGGHRRARRKARPHRARCDSPGHAEPALPSDRRPAPPGLRPTGSGRSALRRTAGQARSESRTEESMGGASED